MDSPIVLRDTSRMGDVTKTATSDGEPAYVRVDEQRPEDYDGTCLRPLGLCELGGCCDVCWYRHDHPRFQRAVDRDKTPET